MSTLNRTRIIYLEGKGNNHYTTLTYSSFNYTNLSFIIKDLYTIYITKSININYIKSY